MSVNVKRFFEKLEEKFDEGVLLIGKTSIAEDAYQQLLNNVVETLKLIKGFDSLVGQEQKQATEDKIQDGGTYESHQGDKEKTKVVLFTSDNCSFCKQLKDVYLPIFKKNNIHVEYVEISKSKEASEFSKSLGITGVPLMLFVVNSKVVYKQSGYDTSKSNVENEKTLLENIKTYFNKGE